MDKEEDPESLHNRLKYGAEIHRGYPATQAVNEAGPYKDESYYKGSTGGLYVDSIKRELERRREKLLFELQILEQALQACTPEAEAALKLARMLDQLGMRTRV